MDLQSQLCNTEHVTPAAILKALLQCGWTWQLCPGDLNCYYMKRDGFDFIIHHKSLDWSTIEGLFTDYGFYIGRTYKLSLGQGADGFDLVH